MFGFFKKKKKELPTFKELQESTIKDKYFSKVAQWGNLEDNMIFVIDPNAARMITMDPWPQTVFLAADGQKTIEEFVYEMASSYSSNVPNGLAAVILQELNGLLSEKIIQLTDHKVNLSPEFLSPIEDRKN